MDVGEILDSEPETPILIPNSPHWRNIKNAWSQENELNGEPSSPTPPPIKRRKATLSNIDPQRQSPRYQSDDDAINEPMPSDNLVPADKHASESIAERASDYAPRRRRFNFAKWVQEDRKTHEYVYKRRFRNFQGPMSDSEDGDYAELQNTGNESLFDYADDDDEVTNEVLDSEAFEHRSDKETNENGSNLETMTRAERYRMKVIDSESSESEIESHENDLIPIFERKLHQSIPAASRKRDHDSLPDSLTDSYSDLLSQTQPEIAQAGNSQERYPSQHLPQLVHGEATEDRGGIDYMLHHKKRTSRSKDTRPITIKQLAIQAGSSACKALRVAARTASRRTPQRNQIYNKTGTPRNSTKAPNESCGPYGKLFVNQSREAMSTLTKWKRNNLFAENSLAKAPKYRALKPIGASESNSHSIRDEIRKTSLKATKSSVGTKHNLNTHIPPLKPQMTISSRPRRKRKEAAGRRFRVESNPNLFRTTIIERSLENPVPLASHATQHARGGTINSWDLISDPPSEADIGPNEEVYTDSYASYTTSKCSREYCVRVTSKSPHFRLDLSRFDCTTFVGSNLLDLLEGPTVWNGKDCHNTALTFKAQVRDSNEARISRDSAIIADLCRDYIEPRTYDELYDYFMQGCAFLIDESEIVAEGFCQYVLYEWLRLGRTLLKMSIRNRWLSKNQTSMSRTLLMTTELVALSVAILHKRVSMLYPEAARSSKVSSLICWMIYYHQSEISRQIDDPDADMRGKVGAELAFTSHKLGLLINMPRIFAKGQDSKANWHIISLIASIDQCWMDWSLARQLVSIEIKDNKGMKTAMLYIQRLLVYWNWEPCAEIIIDLFVYYAKQQHYADPRGESIWLPSFLMNSKFDGSYKPKEDFSLFLELLGITLQRLCNDPVSVLRIAGRVTPLSALSFPESQEVSLADLSSASHQYGILIVLFRILQGTSRPSVDQFRDLVVLKDAHWAIKVKAVSAWNIVTRLAATQEELEECQSWMSDDILQGENLPETLIMATLKSSMDIAIANKTTAIPIPRLSKLGLESLTPEVRQQAWALLSHVCSPKDAKNIPFYSHYTENDIKWAANILLKGDFYLLDEWLSQNNVREGTIASVYTQLIVNGTLNAENMGAAIIKRVICIFINPVPSLEEEKLLEALGFPSISLISERRAALMRFLKMHRFNITESMCSEILHGVQRNIGITKIPEKLAVPSLVADFRIHVFAKFPRLRGDFDMPEMMQFHVLETMQQNLQAFVSHRDFSCYYYLTYKLRDCCDFGSDGDVETSEGNKLVSEFAASLNTGELKTNYSTSDIIINYMLSAFFDMAITTYKTTLKSKASYMLPVLLKIAIVNLGRGVKLEYQCTRFICHVVNYLFQRLKVDKNLAFHPPTTRLILLLSELIILWLHQSASSGLSNGVIVDGILKFSRLLLADLVSSETRTINKLSTDFGDFVDSCHQFNDNNDERFVLFVKPVNIDVISAFKSTEVDDLTIVNENQKTKLVKSVKMLIRNIEIYNKTTRSLS